MTSSVCFKVNTPNVLQETIDGEVVIVNLDSGNYYSMAQVGADIWSFIESGDAVAEVVNAIRQRYDGDHVDVEDAVNQFVDQLQQEALIVPDGAKEMEGIRGLDRQVETGVDTESGHRKASFRSTHPAHIYRYAGLALVGPNP
jgi:hypothetical protein